GHGRVLPGPRRRGGARRAGDAPRAPSGAPRPPACPRAIGSAAYRLDRPGIGGMNAGIRAIVWTFTSAVHGESPVPLVSVGCVGSSNSLRSIARFVTYTN